MSATEYPVTSSAPLMNVMTPPPLTRMIIIGADSINRRATAASIICDSATSVFAPTPWRTMLGSSTALQHGRQPYDHGERLRSLKALRGRRLAPEAGARRE